MKLRFFAHSSSILILIMMAGALSLRAHAEEATPPAPSPAPASTPDPYGLITCSTTTENRTLAIATKEGNGCELHYEKYGKDKVISWSSASVTPCMNSRAKIRKELEAAGWKCTQE